MRAPSKTVVRAKDLRRAMTLPEVLLWRDLRRKALNLRFRRQHPIGPYILDFYCPAVALAVEVDGVAHDRPERAARDAVRDRRLAAGGILVLRFTAPDVLDDRRRDDVMATIAAAAAGRQASNGTRHS